MVESDAAIETLKKIDAVVRFISCNLPHLVRGGPLPIKVGQKLWAARVQLANSGYGGTEFGIPVAAPHKQDIAGGASDWMWMRFSEDLELRWALQGLGDDIYDLQILIWHLSWRNCAELLTSSNSRRRVKGYATLDVFECHPTKSLWKV